MLYDRVSPGRGIARGTSANHVTQPKTTRREKLSFDDAEALQALCGSNNGRLKLIERTAGAQVHLRGNEITIEGDPAATDVVRAVKLIQGNGADPGPTIQGVFGDTILTPRAGRPIAPKGAAQKQYVDLVPGRRGST